MHRVCSVYPCATMSSNYYSEHKLRMMHASQAYMRQHRLSVGGGTPRGGSSSTATFDTATNYDISSTMAKLIREFFVTYVWLLFGWMVVVSPLTDDFWAGPIAFGVTHFVLLDSLHSTSANPLVSIVNLVFNNAQGERPAYHWGAIGMQFAGALTAAYSVNAMTTHFEWVIIAPLATVTDSQVLVMEAIIAFGYSWLYLTVYRTPTDEDSTPIIATASPSLVLGAYWLISTAATNGSLHPWRQLAAAIVSGVYTKCWLYIAADFVGFVIGCIAFLSVFSRKN